jgi:RimJ/RimL family protein N-acetyltransferase
MRLEQRLITNGVIQLVPLQARHQDLFVALYSNEKIMRQIAEPLSPRLAALTFAKAINSAEETRRHYYWVIQNAQGDDSGIAALIMLPDNAAEVGVMLLPKFSRQGLALTASASLFEYAFRFWQTDIVVVSHKATNLPVPSILAGLSMECEVQGDALWHWQLTRQNWQKLTGQTPYQITTVEEFYGN